MDGDIKELVGPTDKRELASQLDEIIVPDVRKAQELGISLLENCDTSIRISAIREAFGRAITWGPLCYHWAFKNEPNFMDLSRTEAIEEEAPYFKSWVPNKKIIPELFPKYHPTEEPQNGDIVTYGDLDGRVKHFGIFRDRQGETRYVESKWAGGHVWLHPEMVLPKGRGEIIRYYSKR